MLLVNTINTYRLLIQLLLTITFLSITNIYTFMYNNVNDISKRALANDISINLLYYYWTHFDWLLYFILFILVYNYIKHVLTINNVDWVFLIFIMVFSELFYIYSSTINFSENSPLVPLFYNTLLSNEINKYHPLLFYITVSNLILLVFTPFRTPIYLNNPVTLTWYKKITNNNLVYIVTTLFMGSWWALQEGSWGGWWNWDSSEMLGLLIMIFFLFNTHNTYTYNYYLNRLNTITLINSIFIYYILIQSNFVIVSHNFGSLSKDIVNFDYWYILLVILALTLVKSMWDLFRNSISVLSNLTTHTLLDLTTNILLYSLTFLLFYILMVSSLPLLSSITFFVSYSNTTNSYFDISYILIPVLIILNYYFFSPTIMALWLGISLLYLNSNTLFILISYMILSTHIQIAIHLTVLFILIISILLWNTSLWFWVVDNVQYLIEPSITTMGSLMHINTPVFTTGISYTISSSFFRSTSPIFDRISTGINNSYIFESINPNFFINTFNILTSQSSTRIIFLLFIISYSLLLLINKQKQHLRF